MVVLNAAMIVPEQRLRRILQLMASPFLKPMHRSTPLLVLSLSIALAPGLLGTPARAAMTLEQACTKFAGKVNDAVTSGDLVKARKIYAEGGKRVASRFNGASCPNVKAP